MLITFANENAANAVEVGAEAIGATMTMTDVHQETRDLHLPGVTAHRLALVTAAPHQDVMLIPMFLMVVAVAIVDRMTAEGVAHLPPEDPSPDHVRLLLPHGAAIETGKRGLLGL